LRGEKTEKLVMAPIFHEITEAVEQLEAMNVSEDGVFDAEEAAAIKKYLGKIQDCCNKLIDLGLYDDSQSKAIRDRAAAAIRSIVLDIHNNLDDLPKAEQLLKIAMQFVGTSSMEHKLKQDLNTFKQNKKDMAKIAPILELMNEKKFTEAIDLIEKTKEAHKDDKQFIDAMDAKKKEAITLYAVMEYIEAKQAMEAKNWDKSIPLFEKSASLVYENIDLFDVNKEIIDSWLETIKSNVKIMASDNADQVDEVHNKMLKQIDDAFEEKFEQIAIKVLINGYYHVGIIKVIKEKGGGGSGWSWLWWVIGFLILSAIFDW